MTGYEPRHECVATPYGIDCFCGYGLLTVKLAIVGDDAVITQSHYCDPGQECVMKRDCGSLGIIGHVKEQNGVSQGLGHACQD